jgi:protein-S-isoprenylcysteine O-methyltransferase
VWILLTKSDVGFGLQWCLYGCVLSFFHLMEFFTTAAFNPASVTYDSYLINHSKAYTIAAILSWTEFWVKNTIVPTQYNWSFPSSQISISIGLVFVIFGQVARSIAMWTARSNFNHIIQSKKHKGHVLVTSGIYTFLRHPSYVGFFYWSIGTQILLGNPFCILAYTLASWKFFNARIPDEEEFLATRIFPNQYPQYMARTYIGIPFIKSYSTSSSGSSSSCGTKDS